jgi:hypothetical protein
LLSDSCPFNLYPAPVQVGSIPLYPIPMSNDNSWPLRRQRWRQNRSPANEISKSCV